MTNEPKFEAELLTRAQSIIAHNFNLGEDETLLVVTDDVTFDVGELFYAGAKSMGRKALMMVMPQGKYAGEEPLDAVAAAMKTADVALCATAKSITHTNARIEAAKAGTRVITMPNVDMSMMRDGATCADYEQVEALTADITALLDQAHTARIEKDGHVLTLNLAGRPGIPSPGVFRAPGASGNFPSGEAYIAPIEDGADGTMVIDGSMVGIGALTDREPIVVTLEHGRLVSMEGADANGYYADQLEVLFARPENGTIAELGIGTNERAILCGIILEDEKLYGTVHIAFGTNASFGGVTKADCHYDGIILKPTLYLDDQLVIDQGEFVCR